jgi:para-aminobenzoate synthetase/4-amino-4-deoxychorismate lyase
LLVLIEFENKPFLFEDPLEVISCSDVHDVPKTFSRMEDALKQGRHLAGFLSYECGYAFEKHLMNNENFDFPLVHFGVYGKPGKWETGNGMKGRGTRDLELGACDLGLGTREINITKDKYFDNISMIKSHISAGDVYQITYCIKFKFDNIGDPFELYKKLKKEQPVPYPAYIETEEFQVLSLSPEMFIKKRGDQVKTKPMKGTWPRGNNFLSDLWAARCLHKDLKNRAENIMIADLLRNDLGRIGHSVKWPKLFDVARYTTLCQMTSTVTAKIDPLIPLYDIFKAIHPSGSVTGAPKIRAMEIIREIENEERRIYTGAIGYITPQRDMFFNVPIRTLLIRERGAGSGKREAEMGVGGGIVWDSTPEGEWEEGMLKAKFLTKLTP